MDSTTKVKPHEVRFTDLMRDIGRGQIRIPDFQREFVWERSQITSLLDSIYRHYPIGSFLFWKTDQEIQSYRNIGEVELEKGTDPSVHYVLDGQQRLTSLFASLEEATISVRVSGKKTTKKLKLYFDLDNDQFVADPFRKDNQSKVPKILGLPAITGQDDYLDFIKSHLKRLEDNDLKEMEVRTLLVNELQVHAGRARHYQSCFRNMGLIEERDELCKPTKLGRVVIDEGSVAPILHGMILGIAFIEEMLPEIARVGFATEEDTVKYLADEHELDAVRWRVRTRLQWLARLGLGEFHQRKLTLSESGKQSMASVLQEIAEHQQEIEEQEEDKKNRYFSIKQITDITQLIQTARTLSDTRAKSLDKVVSRFRDYPFSVISVMDQPIETACEIFERINNSGKVLDVFDLMVAKSWSPTFNLRERVHDFRQELKFHHFDDIKDITILQCVAGMIQKSTHRRDILGTDKNAIEKRWNDVLENIRKTIDFLKTNLRLDHGKILPYNAMLVPLACFFDACKPESLTDDVRKQLVTWFWKAAVSNRYDTGADTKLADDIADMLKLAKGESPEFNYISLPITASRIMDQKLNTGSAFCKTVLCAMNFNQPLELKDSTPVTLASFSKFNSAEFHHLFPQAYLRDNDKEHYPQRDSIANIALAKSSANKEYSNKAPSVYLAGCANANLNDVLVTHLIPDLEESGLMENEFESFIEYRAENLAQVLKLYAGELSEVEAQFVGNESKAIEAFENTLRNILDKMLSDKDPDYWAKTGAPEFRERLESRINDWLRSNPAKQRNDVREIDFCQMMDYLKVMKSHWQIFEPVFRSKSDLEMHFKNIGNFRNALVHARDIDGPTRQLALASLGWFDAIFNVVGNSLFVDQ